MSHPTKIAASETHYHVETIWLSYKREHAVSSHCPVGAMPQKILIKFLVK